MHTASMSTALKESSDSTRSHEKQACSPSAFIAHLSPFSQLLDEVDSVKLGAQQQQGLVAYEHLSMVLSSRNSTHQPKVQRSQVLKQISPGIPSKRSISTSGRTGVNV